MARQLIAPWALDAQLGCETALLQIDPSERDEDDKESPPVSAYRFLGMSRRDVVLVIAGVHESEPQGIAAVNSLKDLLSKEVKAEVQRRPTIIIIPQLFNRRAGQRTIKVAKSPEAFEPLLPRPDAKVRPPYRDDRLKCLRAPATKGVDPNRNFPRPGESYDHVLERARLVATMYRLKKGPELLDCNDQFLYPIDTRREFGLWPRMFAETRILVRLIEENRVLRAASLHAHSITSNRGNAPGMFVDPRGGFDDVTDSAFKEGQADDELARKMLAEAEKGLTPLWKSGRAVWSQQSPPPNRHPLAGNYLTGMKLKQTARLDFNKPTVHYATSDHAPGTSFGGWAPFSERGTPSDRQPRRGMPVLTIEIPQYVDMVNALNEKNRLSARQKAAVLADTKPAEAETMVAQVYVQVLLKCFF